MRKLKAYEDVFDSNPLLRLVVPFMAGILAGDCCWKFFSGDSWLFFALALLFVVGCWVIYRLPVEHLKKYIPFYLSLNAGMMSMGLAVMVSSKDSQQVEWPEQIQDFKVVIVETPKQHDKFWQVTAEIEGGSYDGRRIGVGLLKPGYDVDSVADVGTASPEKVIGDHLFQRISSKSAQMRISATARENPSSDSLDLKSGDRLLLHTVITKPKNSGNPHEFDFAQWTLRQGTLGSAFCWASQWKKSAAGEQHLSLATRALRLRDDLVGEYAKYFKGRDLAILSAMTLGDKTRLDKSTRNLFSQTGVSHVLALSGLHLSILFCIYDKLILSLCRRRWLYVAMSFVGVGSLWLFALMAGLPLSLVRAVIMFSIMQLMSCLRRDVFSVNNLSLAAFVLLLFSPQTLFDVGFQLSFLSVLSIILFSNSLSSPSWLPKNRMVRALFSMLMTSCCAQVVTAPLVAYYFHVFPVLGIFANFVAIPLAYVILGAAIVFFLVPFLQVYSAMALGSSLMLMDEALTYLAGIPGVVLELYPRQTTVWLLYALLLFQVAYFSGKKVAGLYGSAFALLLIAGTELYAHRPGSLPPQLIFYHLRNVPALHCIASNASSYLWSTDYQKADSALTSVRNTFWKEKNINPPLALKDKMSQKDIYYDGRVLAFDGYRIALCYGVPPKGQPATPLKVDYLFFVRGARGELKDWLAFYHPETIVLDASLTDFYEKKYLQEAKDENVDSLLYDLEERGALIVVPSEEKSADR